MSDGKSIESLYDQQASHWSRDTPTLLSDFTARPRVIDALGALDGARVLDLGCGEGYMARRLHEQGASFIQGYDLSAEMIRLACRAITEATRATLQFETADLSNPIEVAEDAFDRAIAVFLFNYLTRSQTAVALQTARKALIPGGTFVFTVPHPSLPWIRPHEPPFFFDAADHTYTSAVDEHLDGRIWHQDGASVGVRVVHKTFSDYFALLRTTGFRIVAVEELFVTEAHLALNRGFFGPLEGTPLHVMFTVEKP